MIASLEERLDVDELVDKSWTTVVNLGENTVLLWTSFGAQKNLEIGRFSLLRCPLARG